MSDTISIHSGRVNFANAAEAIDPATLGAEFLGWEFLSAFDTRQEALEVTHLRWPGGIPVEAGIDVTGDGTRDHVFDFRNPDLMDWNRWAGPDDSADGVPEGKPRQGLSDMLTYANERGMSFAMIAPSARYVETAIETGDLNAAAAEARADARYFAARLARGEFGEVPDKFIVEIGTEYYATDVWRNNNGVAKDNTDGTDFVSDYDLPAAFGRIFSAVTLGLEEGLTGAGKGHGVDIEIAVQAARFHSAEDDGVFNGGPSDNAAFIRQFENTGAIEHVDTVLWHRYAHDFDVIKKGLWQPSPTHVLSDIMAEWEDAAGHDLDLLGGWLSPSLQRNTDPEFGAPGLTNLMHQFAGLIEAGMDAGTVFSLGQPSAGALASGTELFIGGQLYGLMMESLPGKYLHDGFRANTAPTKGTAFVSDGSVNTYVFEGETEYAVFLFAKDIVGSSQKVTLQFDAALGAAELTRLYDAGSLDRISPSHIGVTGVMTTQAVAPVADGSGGASISVTFRQDYEAIRLVVQKAEAGITDGSAGPVRTFKAAAPAQSTSAPAPRQDVSTQIAGETASGGKGPIDGTHGADVLRGTLNSDEINGFGGDDLVIGRSGADVIEGGSGDDRILGEGGDDQLNGWRGDDVITGGSGEDVLNGWADNDTLRGGTGADTVLGGGGQDKLLGGGGADVLVAGVGHDKLFGEGGRDKLAGGSGNDKIWGHADHDRLFGGDGADVLGGGPGNDRLSGGRGHDVLNGGSGHDVLRGDAGNDRLIGGRNNDKMFGGVGADKLIGGHGSDKLFGAGGRDMLLGGSGHDRIFGGVSRDKLVGENGNDILKGEHGRDLLVGGRGHDDLFGGSSADVLFGNSGRDRLLGGGGPDKLFGGGGADVINGEGGSDMLVGGGGADLFVFTVMPGRDRDTVLDFEDGTDRLHMDRAPTEVSDRPGGLLLEFVNDYELFVSGLSASDFDSSDWSLF